MSREAAVLIREFAEADRDAVNDCVRELQEHERAIEPRMKPFEAIAQTYLDGLLAHCRGTQGRILVAEVAGAVVGYVCVYGREPNTDDDEIDYDYAVVADLAVNPSHRGSGIGRTLLAAAERHARAAGARWLRISVLARNRRAFALYEATGFAPRVVELEKDLSN